MTTKTMRCQPGTFIEIDDLAGGRKVVMVGKDGVTFWDMLDAKKVTPIIIHPSFNPVEIGSFAQFSSDKELITRNVLAYLRRRLDARLDNDPLFVMRVLWFTSKKGAGDFEPNDAVLEWACDQAVAQQEAVARNHGYAEKFLA